MGSSIVLATVWQQTLSISVTSCIGVDDSTRASLLFFCSKWTRAAPGLQACWKASQAVITMICRACLIKKLIACSCDAFIIGPFENLDLMLDVWRFVASIIIEDEEQAEKMERGTSL